MSHPIDKTLQLLGKSKNKAASRLLESALSSSNETVRRLAGRELVSSRGVRGLTELIQHTDHPDENTLVVFDEYREKTFAALRGAVVSKDPQLCRNAFRIILARQYFEMLPSLLRIFLDGTTEPGTDSPLLEVIDSLFNKYLLALENGRQRRFLYGTVLSDLLRVLSKALTDYRRNDPPLVLYLFLRLYPFFPEEFREMEKIPRNPSLAVYTAIYKLLLNDDAGTAFEFVFHCLNNQDPPPLAMTILSKRYDIPFLEKVFAALEESVSPTFTENLKRTPHLEWVDKIRVILAQLENAPQKGLVAIVRFAGLPIEEKQSLLIDILRHGKPLGRLAALEALSASSGERIDQLVWQASEDVDPEVQSAALKLLKKRELPKASIRILQFADSPHALVRETVQSLLPDFRFSRFLDTFDQMSDEQRQMMFKLIKKMDPNLVEEIRHQLQSGEPVQRAKSLLCVEYGEMVTDFEEELCSVMMKADNPTLRMKAAQLLAAGRREHSRGMLVQAFHRDPVQEVRTAAKESLEKRPAPWGAQ